ncbi:uncharacterized protein Z520_04756 [Fonsecaea multimorphosa CBS 102226]|uniref:Cytochrome P450 n=1 Tax=Fonsecaea multimorphosa CBS 102226 TaxID=1442371 RepID=A0A0D2HBA3_9EURO|nr:uncharacterized protein Z520_04756 [Fonsecaea multimorphosa CBS 102226]KIX99180.1 hypothetical protein Z520_04756 [Fonsecaea multimorphosa CBS 102226]OAL25877.1 hypothetical protein AYO22_04504 [Fonsecaea multimorphosa]
MAVVPMYLGWAVGLLFSFIVVRAVYRVTLHPLAKFPGPKLAGMTSLYQAWYDLRSSTSYIKQFHALHERYGPIVRITPSQLHIFDMAAYNEIFKIGTRYARHRDNYCQDAADGFFNVLDPKAAKPWRDAYQPYFAKGAIIRLEPLIHDRIGKFLSVLEEAASSTGGTPVDLSMGYRSLTSDVVTSYMFADKGFDLLDAEGFRSPILVALEEFFEFTQWYMYFPNFMGWLGRQLQRLTKEQTEKLMPALAATNWITEQCGIKVKRIMQEGGSGSSFPTVFDAWAKPSEKRSWTPTLKQLTADAFTFHGAGTDTTAHTLTTATWGLINNKECLEKLRVELKAAIPTPNSEQLVSSSVLENLPYLRAVVKESLRMSMGVPGRLGRVVPEGGAVLCQQQIPAGVGITSVCYCYHYDPAYFPSPDEFRPERWLMGPESQQLESRLIAFSRGPRSCIGINLAYAELYLTLGYVFRKFDVEAYATTHEDMEWKDNFVVTTKGHLRVKVTRAVDGEAD